jgi:hypothetical protein
MGILDLHVLLSLYLVKNLSTRAGKQVSIFAFKERERECEEIQHHSTQGIQVPNTNWHRGCYMAVHE